MIELLLIRMNVHEKRKFTKGKMFLRDSGIWLYHTLEDQVRDINADGDLKDERETKVYGETAIPYGTYEGFLRYSPNLKRFVPELKDVPHFEHIQIHALNDISQSLGCIGVGFEEGLDTIYQSRDAERDLVDRINKSDGKFRIKIV